MWTCWLICSISQQNETLKHPLTFYASLFPLRDKTAGCVDVGAVGLKGCAPQAECSVAALCIRVFV